MTHAAVLMGGWSAERDISLVSGRGCADALRSQGFQVSEVDVGHDLAEVLADLRPDVAFNALHGPWGEDGCVQGLLEVMEIPYTHSGVLASALAMDKPRAKEIFRAAGLPVAHGIVVSRRTLSGGSVNRPCVLKPVNQGSSVGVFILREAGDRLPDELTADDWPHGDDIMVEDFIDGQEITCAVMGDRALDIIAIIAAGAFYDYRSKYDEGGSRHVLPADLPPETYRRVQEISLEAHRSLGCRGVSRADFIHDDVHGDGPILLEVNTQPGMTPTSLVPEMAAHAGISYPALVRWMAEDASCGR